MAKYTEDQNLYLFNYTELRAHMLSCKYFQLVIVFSV